MNVAFTHPHWLWLLPPVVAWVLWLALKSDNSLRSWRRWAVLALRLAICIALVCAIAGLQWLKMLDGMNVFFVLDRSDSVSSDQQSMAEDWVADSTKKMPPDDRAGLIVFGREARIESTPQHALRPRHIDSVVPTDRSDLGGAIRLATAAFPEQGQRRIVLLTDGNENLGDATAASASARAQNVSVDVAPIYARRKFDVAVQRMQTPATVREGQSFDVRIFVDADVAGPAKVSLFRNHAFLGEQAVQLDAGKNLLTFPQALSEPGFYGYDVVVESTNDAIPQDNRAYAFTDVRGKPRVLLVSDDPTADSHLVDAIHQSEVDVRVISPTAWPDNLAELRSYDSIVLSNVQAADLNREAQEQLEIAVRDFGVGLVCVGGDQTYAAGAYRGSILDGILPLDSEISSKKVLPPGALVLIIDKSGSMAGQKIEVAKQAAMAALSVLSDRDYVAVLAFDGQVYQAADIQLAKNRKNIMELISGIKPGGGTSLFPPMQIAHDMLKRVPASLKHCIILTDGRSVPGDFEGVTRGMAKDRITISAVGIGVDVDANLLEGITSLGHGRFYQTTSLDMVPQLFIKETAVILKTAINEEPFQAQLVANSEVIRGIGIESAPPLLGYVVTMPKARAETPLVTGKGDPLLAHWQYGLGRAVAFTSDARPRWAQQWLGWSEYQRFWRQIINWSLRRTVNPDSTTAVTISGDQGTITVDALNSNGEYQNFLELNAVVVAPSGNRETVSLHQTGSGHYEAHFATKEIGAYLVNLRQMERGKVTATQTIGASLNYSPELGDRGANVALLRRIAGLTGGQELTPGDPDDNPFAHDRRPTFQPHDLWRVLLQLSVLFFVADVGLRRVQLDSDFRRWVSPALSALIRFGRNRSTPPPSEPSLSALLARRQQVRSTNVTSSDWSNPTPPSTNNQPAFAKNATPEEKNRAEPTPAAEASAEDSTKSLAGRLREAKHRAIRRRR